MEVVSAREAGAVSFARSGAATLERVFLFSCFIRCILLALSSNLKVHPRGCGRSQQHGMLLDLPFSVFWIVLPSRIERKNAACWP